MIFQICFIIVSLLNIIFTYLNKIKLKDIFKTLIIPLLIVCYVINVNEVNYLLIIALILAYIGDIVLIPEGNKTLIAGGTCFALSNLCFLVIFITTVSFDNPDYYLLVLFISFLSILTYITLFYINKYLDNKNRTAINIYLILNATLSYVAVVRMMFCPHIRTLLTFVGTLLYYISDVLLINSRYNSDRVSKYFVMPLYIGAITLITLSYIL